MNSLSRRLLAVGIAGAVSLGILGVVRAENAAADKPQAKAGRRAQRGERGLRMSGLAALNLAADQQAKLKAMQEEQRPRREAITNDTARSAMDKRQELRELRKESHQKFLAVLTPEQREKLAAYRKEMKAKRAAKKGATS